MVAQRKIDRRQVASRAIRLGQPLFIQVPKAVAASSLAACALITIFASNMIPSTIELGSVFLLICAFAAWFVGNRFVIMLGLFIVAVQCLNGLLIDFRHASIDDFIDAAFQLSCASAVVLMLGVARVALEIEWRHARVDPLTGALNRKAFFEVMGSETNNDSLAVLIFADLDGLKRLNDRLGHEKGDDAIRSFADCVRKSIRKHDVFARIGGDEFVVYLNVGDVMAAQTVAERLNNALNFQPDDETKLKCSLGILLLPEGSKSIDVELRQADALMYDAKRSQAGFSIAMMVDANQEKLIQIASGINARDLEAAKLRSSQRQSSQRSVTIASPNNPIAA